MYVGVTAKTVEERFAGHCREAFSNRSQHYPLYLALRKYGPASVTVHTLAGSEDWAELCQYERMFIALFGSQDRALGYNRTSGGDGMPDPSDDVREKMSTACRARWADLKYREKMSNAARKQWARPERRERMSAANREQWANDPEYREKMAAVRLQQKPRALAALSENLPDYGAFINMGYTEPVDFVDRVRVAVQRSPMGYEQLARASGVGRTAVRQFATRQRHPTDSTLRRLAEVLGVPDGL